jgi:hypothetical protein
MKILYIGTYRQKDDWGHVSRNYIRALLSNKNIQLSIRPIYLSMGNTLSNFNDDDIISAESHVYDSYDCVIQHVLPNYFVYNKKAGKNIGIYSLDILNLNDCDIISKLNLLDEVWVPSPFEKECLQKSGVIKSIKVIGFPTNIASLDTILNDHNPYLEEKELFKLYTRLDSGTNKNIIDTIVSYILAFDYDDKTNLVIYAGSAASKISEIFKEIYKQMNISKHIREPRIISSNLSNDHEISLHRHSDCYLNLNYGQSFDEFSVQACIIGNNPIINKNTALRYCIDESNGFLVKSYRTPVIIENNPIANNTDYYNANQSWYKIDIYDAVEKLRNARDMFFNDKDSWNKKSDNCKSLKDNFSYETIGNNICTLDA